ncbi:MAG: hypothetical protein U0930_05640 [Pirellulales bacterium]
MSQSVIALNHVYNCGGTQGILHRSETGILGNRIVANKVHADRNCRPRITVHAIMGKEL